MVYNFNFISTLVQGVQTVRSHCPHQSPDTMGQHSLRRYCIPSISDTCPLFVLCHMALAAINHVHFFFDKSELLVGWVEILLANCLLYIFAATCCSNFKHALVTLNLSLMVPFWCWKKNKSHARCSIHNAAAYCETLCPGQMSYVFLT
jgi:hypothetical protein